MKIDVVKPRKDFVQHAQPGTPNQTLALNGANKKIFSAIKNKQKSGLPVIFCQQKPGKCDAKLLYFNNPKLTYCYALETPIA